MYVRTAEEFMQENSQEGQPIQAVDADGELQRTWLFPSGARLTNDGLAPRCYEPSPDEEQRLLAQQRYHATWIDKLRSYAVRLKATLLGQKTDDLVWVPFTWPEHELGPAPSPDGVEALKHLNGLIVKHKQAIDQIETRLTAIPAVQLRRQQEEQGQVEMARRQAAAQNTYNAIQQIPIE